MNSASPIGRDEFLAFYNIGPEFFAFNLFRVQKNIPEYIDICEAVKPNEKRRVKQLMRVSPKISSLTQTTIRCSEVYAG